MEIVSTERDGDEVSGCKLSETYRTLSVLSELSLVLLAEFDVAEAFYGLKQIGRNPLHLGR